MSFVNGLRSRQRFESLGGRSGYRRRRAGFLPALDSLEVRALLSTIVVTNTHDSGAGSLRQAILVAPGGSTISFANSLKGQTIVLTSGELSISQNLNIAGPGAASLAVSGGGSSQVLDVASGANVTISGLTITDGFSTDGFGGGIVNSGSLTLKNSAVTGNRADAFFIAGGGIYNNGNLTIDQTNVTGNEAIGETSGAQGGGIENDTGGVLTIKQSVISNNHAICVMGVSAQGGAIDNEIGASTTIIDSTVSGNSAFGGDLFFNGGSATGGAIYSLGTLSISGSELDANQALGGDSDNFGGTATGGAIFLSTTSLDGVATPATLSMMNSTVNGNQAIGGSTTGNGIIPVGGTAEGGAIVGDGASMMLAGCTFSNNQALGGAGGEGTATAGALSSFEAILLTISGCTFTANEAIGGDGPSQPGALVTEGASATGGAIESFQDPLIIRASVFKNNEAIGGNALPGGIFNLGGLAGGGALGYNTGSSSVTASVSGSSFTGNQAIAGVGIGGGQVTGEGGALDLGGPLVGPSTFLISQTSITNNFARGGADATATSSASSGEGGGVFSSSSITISGSTITGNQALGGTSSSSVAGGSGEGGGLYNYLGTMTISNTLIASNRAVGGAGIAAIAGAGEDGGIGQGGGVFTLDGSLAINHSQLTSNSATGGVGGLGGAGGSGEGGGLFASNIVNFTFPNGQTTVIGVGATVTVTESSFTANVAQGGAGGTGGNGQGGGIGSLASAVDLNNTQLVGNTAAGGSGGNGVAGGAGGAGGSALGGGLYSSGSSSLSFVDGEVVVTPVPAAATVTNSSVIGNVAQGGDGGAGAGAGGAGGLGAGGGAYNDNASSLSISGSLLSFNEAAGGRGGAGGSTGTGGSGGNGFGGAIFNAGPGTIEFEGFVFGTLPGGTLDLAIDLVTANLAIGGSAGHGAANGSTGQGTGGGLYLATGGTATVNQTLVVLNSASTSDRNIHGTTS